jgi:dihydropteroate synthase
MGIVNVTPDSFSDGGRWLDSDAAVQHGLDLLARGADILDVGGESTRPGASRPGVDEELRRVLPVVEGLAAAGAFVSVDTMRASVAKAALERGAALVNDVSGGLADTRMLAAVAEAEVPYVLMHWRGHADVMAQATCYEDVVGAVVHHLEQRCKQAVAAGVSPDRLIVDPGLGFAKESHHNWALLAALDRIGALGFPVLVGASRKRFLRELLSSGDSGRVLDGETALDSATAAVTARAASAGAWCVRVHEPELSADAVRVVARVDAARSRMLTPLP